MDLRRTRRSQHRQSSAVTGSARSAAGPSRPAASEPPSWNTFSPREAIFFSPTPVLFAPGQQSVAGSASSRESSYPVFTPESTRSPSVTRGDIPLSPEPRLPSRVSPDEPIPSVETAIWADAPSGASTPITRLRVPSVSTSPPSSSALLSPFSSRDTPNVPRRLNLAQDSSEARSLVDRLDRLVINRLDRTPPGMGLSDIRAELANLSINTGRRGPLSGSPTPAFRYSSLSPRPPLRSRAGSEAPLVYHDVKDEGFPESRFHAHATQSAIQNAKNLMTQLVGVLSDSPLHTSPDSTIKRLHDHALGLSQSQGSSTRTVGFVGDSGVGKSSVLNSLLDQKDLARTGNNGAACTCVVTEYHYEEGDNFAIEVELFSHDDIMEQMKELLQSYRRFHLNRAEIRIDEGEAAAIDIEEQANVARDTFRSTFKGQLTSEDFLTNESETTVMRTFKSWLQDIDIPLEGRHKTASKKDCADFLIYLTSESADARTPAVWPFVRKIKVFLSSYILSKGLILADLPGLRDLNSARRHITEKYLDKCDGIFAVCNIGRATTDVGVQSVFELAQQAKLSSVGIICTKSDDIRVEEAINDWRDQRADRIQQLRDADTTAQYNTETISHELKDIDGMETTELTDEQQLYLNELNKKQRQANKTSRKSKFELQEYLINTRNDMVARQLRTTYGNKVPGGNLAVFCVSNTLYWDERYKPSDVALPSLQLSGVLPLRRYCFGVTAQSQFSMAKKFIDTDIPAVLGEAALWIESGAGSACAERKRQIRVTLDSIESRLKRELTGRYSDLSLVGKSIKDEFKTRVYDNRRTDAWRTAAVSAALEWESWAPGTYSAFCRSYGKHKTDIAGSHDWNEEIIHKMAEDVTPQWDMMAIYCREKLEQSGSLITSRMDGALEYLENDVAAFTGVTDPLMEIWTSHKSATELQLEELIEKLRTDLNTLRRDALTGIRNRTSILGKAMEAPYKRCNAIYGGRSDRKRKSIIHGAVNSVELFENHMAEFKRRVRALADLLQTELQAIVRARLAGVATAFELIRNENVATESEENPELRCRLAQEIATIKERMGPIIDVMA